MKKNSLFTIRVALIVALGGFLMGFDASVIFGIFGAVGLVFVQITLPETKGKSLEELEKILVEKV